MSYNPYNSGGFMPQSQDSPSTFKKKEFGQQQQSVRPVMIKQLLETHQPNPEEPSFFLDSKELTVVTVVGCVRKVIEQSTNLTVIIEDGTGIMEAKQWIHSAQDSDLFHQKRQLLRENVYVRIYANLRVFQQKKSLSVLQIQLVQDHNEITYHALQALYTHLQLTGNTMRHPQGSQSNQYSDYMPQSSHQQPQGVSDFEGLQKQIIDFVGKNGQSGEGVHIPFMASQLGVPERELRAQVEYLMSEGHLYSTLDDDHCQLTSC